MAVAKFICPICKKEYQIPFKAGKPIKPVCDNADCNNQELERIFNNIELNDVVSDEMLHIGQMMLYT